MWKSYKYLYYKLYKLFVKMNGQDDFPEYTAMLGVGTLSFFNILAVFSTVNVFYPFWSFPEISRATFFIYVGVPYTLLLYFAFVFNKKYIRIIKEFQDENEEQRKRGRRNVILYMSISLLLVIASLSLIALKNEGVI